VEVAAMNNRHRRFGHNAAEELARRVDLRAEGKYDDSMGRDGF
jgi:HPr kinase/phosphorylase